MKTIRVAVAVLGSGFLMLLIGPDALAGPALSRQARLPTGGTAQDQVGQAVAISAGTLLVGAPGDDTNGADAGAARVFVGGGGGGWALQQKLLPAAGTSTFFGGAVAIDHDTAVVGAYGDATRGSYAGAAYVFVRSGTSWSLQQKITAPAGAAMDYFGFSVAVSGDTLAVGAFGDDERGTDAGAVYLFVRSGGVWSLQQKVTSTSLYPNANLGVSVALDGDTLLAGAPGDGSGTGFRCAAGQHACRCGSTDGTLCLPAAQACPDPLATCPSNVQFSCDPERPTCTCATGAVCGFPGGLCTQPSAPCLATTTGAAYVFTRSGTTWSEQDKLGPTSSQVDDNFGGAVALSADTAIVGAFQDHDRGPGAGAAYVYSHTGTTNWLYRQKLLASDGVTGDGFGVSVAAEVGSRVLVGAFTSDAGGADAGAAYVFDLDVPSGSWVATQKLTAADAAPSDLFGNAVAVSGDVAVVGAYGKSDTATVAGAAYVFEPLAMAVPAVGSRGLWTLAALLLAAAAVAGTRGRSSVRGGVRGRGLR